MGLIDILKRQRGNKRDSKGRRRKPSSPQNQLNLPPAPVPEPEPEYELHWLDTEPAWQDRLGQGWVGQSMLGRGGQGMVGHWTYTGADRSQKSVRDVAVKQGPAYIGDMAKEEGWLKLFQGIGTPHIVRMYRHLYNDMGQDTDETLDTGTVSRIFLEYCPNGDLWKYYDTYQEMGKMVDESKVWAMFHCLARATHVMKAGTEDLEDGQVLALPGSGELVHLDLKPGNVLIGSILNDREHVDRPACKISDFGLATLAPETQDAAYLKPKSNLGTVEWLLPEQIQPGHKFDFQRPWNIRQYDERLKKHVMTTTVRETRLGTASNVWAIGLIVYFFMIQPKDGRNGFPWGSKSLEIYCSDLSSRLKSGGHTLGVPELIFREQGHKSLPYSKNLHALVAECLLVSPASRISSTDLVRETQRGKEACRIASGEIPELREGLPDPYREPDLSERWYSGQRGAKPTHQPSEASTEDDDFFDLILASGGLGGLGMGGVAGLRAGSDGGLEEMFGNFDQRGRNPALRPENSPLPAQLPQGPRFDPSGPTGGANAQTSVVVASQRAPPAPGNPPPQFPIRVRPPSAHINPLAETPVRGQTPPVPITPPPPPPKRGQFAPLPPLPAFPPLQQPTGDPSGDPVNLDGLLIEPVDSPNRSVLGPLPAPTDLEARREPQLAPPNINSAGRYHNVVFHISPKSGLAKIATMRNVNRSRSIQQIKRDVEGIAEYPAEEMMLRTRGGVVMENGRTVGDYKELDDRGWCIEVRWVG